jgi:hypothetical protein
LKALISLRLLLLVEPFPFSFGCLLLRFMGFLDTLIFLRNPSPCRITVYFWLKALYLVWRRGILRHSLLINRKREWLAASKYCQFVVAPKPVFVFAFLAENRNGFTKV